MPAMAEPFWKTKTLEDMSASEWESLCDGCGKCCLSKLEDEDTGDIYFTSVGCRLFDAGTCRCRDYPNRLAVVQDCVGLTPANVRTISWLPGTCAYRLVAEGRDLFAWHPLVSGDPCIEQASQCAAASPLPSPTWASPRITSSTCSRRSRNRQAVLPFPDGDLPNEPKMNVWFAPGSVRPAHSPCIASAKPFDPKPGE